MISAMLAAAATIVLRVIKFRTVGPQLSVIAAKLHKL
jgi:hypothetical protein